MSSGNQISRKQCNVQLPKNLVDELKAEAHRLTGHRRRGFSDLLAICASYGWDAYQLGKLAVDREAKVVSYHLIKHEE